MKRLRRFLKNCNKSELRYAKNLLESGKKCRVPSGIGRVQSFTLRVQISWLLYEISQNIFKKGTDFFASMSLHNIYLKTLSQREKGLSICFGRSLFYFL